MKPDFEVPRGVCCATIVCAEGKTVLARLTTGA